MVHNGLEQVGRATHDCGFWRQRRRRISVDEQVRFALSLSSWQAISWWRMDWRQSLIPIWRASQFSRCQRLLKPTAPCDIIAFMITQSFFRPKRRSWLPFSQERKWKTVSRYMALSLKLRAFLFDTRPEGRKRGVGRVVEFSHRWTSPPWCWGGGQHCGCWKQHDLCWL